MKDKYPVIDGIRIICLDDPILFETEKKFIDFVRTTGFSEAECRRLIAHERSHYEVAEREGLKPTYMVRKGLGTINSLVHDIYRFYVRYEGCNETTEIKIALAPSDPSKHDKNDAKNAKKKQDKKIEEIVNRIRKQVA